MMRLMKDS